jgi:hypothetical protein
VSRPLSARNILNYTISCKQLIVRVSHSMRVIVYRISALIPSCYLPITRQQSFALLAKFPPCIQMIADKIPIGILCNCRQDSARLRAGFLHDFHPESERLRAGFLQDIHLESKRLRAGFPPRFQVITDKIPIGILCNCRQDSCTLPTWNPRNALLISDADSSRLRAGFRTDTQEIAIFIPNDCERDSR